MNDLIFEYNPSYLCIEYPKKGIFLAVKRSSVKGSQKKQGRTGSGFDCGHNCPSEDRTNSVEANYSTFLITNMIPKAPSLNQGPWQRLEDFIRSKINAGTEAYIIMGTFGMCSYDVSGKYAEAVDNGRMTLPVNVWKIAGLITEYRLVHHSCFGPECSAFISGSSELGLLSLA